MQLEQRHLALATVKRKILHQARRQARQTAACRPASKGSELRPHRRRHRRQSQPRHRRPAAHGHHTSPPTCAAPSRPRGAVRRALTTQARPRTTTATSRRRQRHAVPPQQAGVPQATGTRCRPWARMPMGPTDVGLGATLAVRGEGACRCAQPAAPSACAAASSAGTTRSPRTRWVRCTVAGGIGGAPQAWSSAMATMELALEMVVALLQHETLQQHETGPHRCSALRLAMPTPQAVLQAHTSSLQPPLQPPMPPPQTRVQMQQRPTRFPLRQWPPRRHRLVTRGRASADVPLAAHSVLWWILSLTALLHPRQTLRLVRGRPAVRATMAVRPVSRLPRVWTAPGCRLAVWPPPMPRPRGPTRLPAHVHHRAPRARTSIPSIWVCRTCRARVNAPSTRPDALHLMSASALIAALLGQAALSHQHALAVG